MFEAAPLPCLEPPDNTKGEHNTPRPPFPSPSSVNPRPPQTKIKVIAAKNGAKLALHLVKISTLASPDIQLICDIGKSLRHVLLYHLCYCLFIVT